MKKDNIDNLINTAIILVCIAVILATISFLIDFKNLEL